MHEEQLTCRWYQPPVHVEAGACNERQRFRATTRQAVGISGRSRNSKLPRNIDHVCRTRRQSPRWRANRSTLHEEVNEPIFQSGRDQTSHRKSALRGIILEVDYLSTLGNQPFVFDLEV